jgi:hypothetical protein
VKCLYLKDLSFLFVYLSVYLTYFEKKKKNKIGTALDNKDQPMISISMKAITYAFLPLCPEQCLVQKKYTLTVE